MLAEFIKRVPGGSVVGDSSRELGRPRHDSREVRAGDLFCAIRGEAVDGNRFAPQAVDAGASAVLTADPELALEIPVLRVPDDRAAMAAAAHAYYGDPTKTLRVVGITGTNGKTTTSHMLQSVLNAAGGRCGRIGTVGWEFGGHGEPLVRTTPEAPELVELVANMRELGATDLVMEVTSIALPMCRVDGFEWAAGLFTNLSQDHLDLHGSMEAYFAAKKSFFQAIASSRPAVSNLDDEWGGRMLEGVQAQAVGFGFEIDTDVRGRVLEESAAGMKIEVKGFDTQFELQAPYVGQFNAENVLGAATTALALGISADAIEAGIAHAPQVRGRMERLRLEGGVTAIVDYAHTPDALQRALRALRSMTSGKLIVVVGAGGDRDRAKRPLMGRIASGYADHAIITSDNPRTEDPEAIVREVLAGADSANTTSIVKRREAIGAALEMAGEGDVVLIAGKGHETYQEIDGVRHHFDDREEVLKLRREV